MSKGMIHLYCGDGKGKTTAAVGLALRHIGFGGRVLFTQFLKSAKSSELKAFEAFSVNDSIKIISGKSTDKFTFQMNEEELKECIVENNQRLREIIDLEKKGIYSMLVLDEVVGTLSLGLLDKALLLELIKGKKQNTELVLTGRGQEDWLVELCDYVSEIKKIKHPYDVGIMAREGIEY